jgi:hypothetical protein
MTEIVGIPLTKRPDFEALLRKKEELDARLKELSIKPYTRELVEQMNLLWNQQIAVIEKMKALGHD